METEEDPAEDLTDIQEGHPESLVEVKSTQHSVKRSTRRPAGHHRT